MLKLAMFVGVAVTAACGASKAPATSTTSSASGDPAAVASAESPGVPCANDVQLQCTSGVDGCTDNKTTVHVCIAADAVAGPACSQEIALECPDGQIDACLLSPAAGENHICVMK
ncbi:MAG: hypothetical protein AB7P03_25830 [Kofleriaceae bacterium]